MQFVPTATQLFSILTIICQIGIVILIFNFLVKHPFKSTLHKFLQKYALLLSFLIALVSMLGSLFYSEIAQFQPCKLCWYQRILMYPLVLLLGTAYVRRDNNIALYIMQFSLIGAGIALYHYLIQIGTIGEILPCTAVGYSISCAEKFVMTYGYITIPLMAFSAFLLLFLLMLTLKLKTK